MTSLPGAQAVGTGIDGICAHGFYTPDNPLDLEIEHEALRLLDKFGCEIPEAFRQQIIGRVEAMNRRCASHPTLAQQRATIEARGLTWIDPDEPMTDAAPKTARAADKSHVLPWVLRFGAVVDRLAAEYGLAPTPSADEVAQDDDPGELVT